MKVFWVKERTSSGWLELRRYSASFSLVLNRAGNRQGGLFNVGDLGSILTTRNLAVTEHIQYPFIKEPLST